MFILLKNHRQGQTQINNAENYYFKVRCYLIYAIVSFPERKTNRKHFVCHRKQKAVVRHWQHINAQEMSVLSVTSFSLICSFFVYFLCPVCLHSVHYHSLSSISCFRNCHFFPHSCRCLSLATDVLSMAQHHICIIITVFLLLFFPFYSVYLI